MTEQLSQDKIALINKHLYDRVGNLTEKGKAILKEVGIFPEDIDDKPLEFFKKKNEHDDIANARYDFYQKKRLNKLQQLQKSLQPYIYSYQTTIKAPTIFERTTIKNLNRLNQTLSNIFQKKPLQMAAVGSSKNKSSYGVNTFSPDQPLSANSTYMTDVKDAFSPMGRQRPESVTAKNFRNRGRNSLQEDGLRTLTRPQSSTLHLFQEDRDLKWMKVQENSITRSEEKLVKYKIMLNKYDQRMQKQEKRFEEDNRDRIRQTRSVQMKRNMVKSYKDKTIEEHQNEAFKQYLDEVEKRRTGTPNDKEKRQLFSPTALGRNQTQSKSQANFKSLNRSISATSSAEKLQFQTGGLVQSGTTNQLLEKHLSPSSSNLHNRNQMNKDIELHLDTIKERLRKGYQRRKARNQEIQDKLKQHVTQIEKNREMYLKGLSSTQFQMFDQFIKNEQRRQKLVDKNQQDHKRKLNYKKVKVDEKNTRSQSTKQFLMQERDSKLQRIVTDYHTRIDQQTAVARSQRRVSSLVKRAVRVDLEKTNLDNTFKFKQWKDEMSESVLQKTKQIEQSKRRIQEMRDFKQYLSLQSNFFRQMHKQQLLKGLITTHKTLLDPNPPGAFKQRPRTQGQSMLVSPTASRGGGGFGAPIVLSNRQNQLLNTFAILRKPVALTSPTAAAAGGKGNDKNQMNQTKHKI